MMATKKRLEEATRRLSPKEIVLLKLAEGHALGSGLAYAKKLLREGPDEDVCGRIAASIDAENGHRNRWRERSAHETETIREAQREGLFLWGLAMRCEELLTDKREALDLRWLLWNQTLLTFEALNRQAAELGEGFEPLFTIGQVGRELRAVRDEVFALAGAVRLIEETYFDGHRVLFPYTRVWLEKLRARTSTLLASFHEATQSPSDTEWAHIAGDDEHAHEFTEAWSEPGGADPRRVAKSAQVVKAAARHARTWIRLTRAMVHDKMGERGLATRELIAVC